MPSECYFGGNMSMTSDCKFENVQTRLQFQRSVYLWGTGNIWITETNTKMLNTQVKHCSACRALLRKLVKIHPSTYYTCISSHSGSQGSRDPISAVDGHKQRARYSQDHIERQTPHSLIRTQTPKPTAHKGARPNHWTSVLPLFVKDFFFPQTQTEGKTD